MTEKPPAYEPGTKIDAPYYSLVFTDYDAIRVITGDSSEEVDAKVAAYMAGLPPSPKYSRWSTLAWRLKWWLHDRLFGEDHE